MEYILTIGMMLGLRVAVGRQANPLAKPELTVEDFYQARFLLLCVCVVFCFSVESGWGAQDEELPCGR